RDKLVTGVQTCALPIFNPSVLDALDHWVFQPVLLNGKPVAAKVLLGIPLFLSDRLSDRAASTGVATVSIAPASGATPSAPPPPQIGRASCRERAESRVG